MKNRIYTFKVSLNKGIFRVIEIKSKKSLEDLAHFIIECFDFEMDHAFGFYNNVKDLYKSEEIYELFADIDGCEVEKNVQGVQNTKIDSVFVLEKKMLFLFDYGDQWIFLIECIAISDSLEKTKYPRIIEKVGKSPEQYQEYCDEA
ncbi:hypothetical protein EBU95_18745 [bacterium]|nr:hypothetical protein [bacterium]